MLQWTPAQTGEGREFKQGWLVISRTFSVTLMRTWLSGSAPSRLNQRSSTRPGSISTSLRGRVKDPRAWPQLWDSCTHTVLGSSDFYTYIPVTLMWWLSEDAKQRQTDFLSITGNKLWFEYFISKINGKKCVYQVLTTLLSIFTQIETAGFSILYVDYFKYGIIICGWNIKCPPILEVLTTVR